MNMSYWESVKEVLVVVGVYASALVLLLGVFVGVVLGSIVAWPYYFVALASFVVGVLWFAYMLWKGKL